MNCKKCSNKLPADAKFCNKCGTPVQLDPVLEAKNKSNITSLKKSVVTAGNSAYAIGWITIILNCAIYLWSLLDKNYSQSGLPATDLGGVYIMVMASVIFIILGKRIKKLNDRRIRAYLITLLVTAIVLFTWVVSSGGRIGILAILVIIYLITAIRSVSKLLKIEEFSSTLTEPKYKLNKTGWIIFGVAAFFMFFVVIGFDSIMQSAFETDTIKASLNSPGVSKEDTIKQIVESAKSQTTLPSELDSVTTLTDIIAEPSAIRYEYVLHDVQDTSNISNTSLKNLISPDLCKNKTLTAILDRSIDIEYSYVVRGSYETYFVTFTNSDCSAI